MAEIVLENLKKTYLVHRKKEKIDLEIHALDGFNLHVNEGEFMVLTGPSGSGKSTVLRCVAGFENYEGKVIIDDEEMEDVPPNQRNMAMVFQEYALYPNRTAFHNMAFGLEVRRMDRDEIKRRVFEMADLLDIRFLLNRRPKAMSLGQRQRIAIGRAVIREPEVLLMDEPLSNLDPRGRGDLLDRIELLHKKFHRTCLYVTHDQTEAMRIADRIAVVNNGKVEQVDTPDAIYNRPVNTFVATFFGAPPMTLISGKLVSEDGKIALRFGEQPLLVLNEENAKLCKDFVGKDVQFCFRPEDMEEVEKVEDNLLYPTLKFMNQLGAEVYMYVDIPGACDKDIAIRTGGVYRPRSNEKVMIRPNMSKIHIFDKETRQRLN